MNEVSLFMGDDRTIQISITDKETGLPEDLTGATVTMRIKKHRNDTDAESIIVKSSDTPSEGAIVGDATLGVVEFYIVPNDTLDLMGNVRYDVPYLMEFKVLDSLSKTYTVLRSWFTIL